MPTATDDEQAVATNTLAPSPSESDGRGPRKAEVRRESTVGYFTVYKSGQGYWTRMGTAAGAALIALLSIVVLYPQLITWLSSLLTPRTIGMDAPARDMALSHAAKLVRYSSMGICAAFLLIFAGFAWWLMNKPTNAEFLIATDSEMKKVNWTSRQELIGSTKVVVGFMFGIAFFLFFIDQLFQAFFYVTHVQSIPPFFLH